jgi:CheY-like chemotaxis protein
VRLPQQCTNYEPIGADLAENLMKHNLKNTVKMRNALISKEFMPYGSVLVIDDVETNLYVARGLMTPYGISIDTALSGFEAIEKISNGAEYDILFMDHMMPKMDGIETAKHIRNLGYDKPIVALTANALAGQAEMFLNNGFDDFISKPIDTRQLNSVLNKLIRDKQPPEVLKKARKQRDSLYPAVNDSIEDKTQLAEIFLRDAKKTITVLEAINKNKIRRDDDLIKVIINVHAMKSALANIGENELSYKASELEQAGRDQNIDLVLSLLPDFLESLQHIIKNIAPPDEDPQEEETYTMEEADRVYLQEKLSVIQTACASYNKKAAKTALTELRKKTWPRDVRDLLGTISEYLLHSDFDKSIQKIKETKL